MLKIYREKFYTYKKAHYKSTLYILNSKFCIFINHIKLTKKKKHCHLVNLSKVRTPLQNLCKSYVFT